MLAPTTRRLASMHRNQIARDDWPDFSSFARSAYQPELLRGAAVQWAGRARAEYGSVHQFTEVAHALAAAQIELELLGGLARLITDEVRHAALCHAMARACVGGDPAHDSIFRWERPAAPWPDPPSIDEGLEPLLAWAARAIAIACCIGETLSRPMLEAIAVVATEPVSVSVTKQILRDEHLHAAFGWESLGVLLPRLSVASKRSLEADLSEALGGVEASTACGISIEEVAGTELSITSGGPDNLGVLTDEQYAMIFFATIEREVLPGFRELGLDADRAWASRPRPRTGSGRSAPAPDVTDSR